MAAGAAISYPITHQSQISFPNLNPQRIRISSRISNSKPNYKSIKALPMATAATSSVGISETFSRLKDKAKVAFIPYITAGDPDLTTTAKALKVLDACGCDIIELGVPYSDPLADGPVIQAASARSLARGTTFNLVLSMLKEVAPQLSCPIVLFAYYNQILKQGVDKFMITLKDVGIHGLVVPDVVVEDTPILKSEAAKNNIELVLLTTSTTPAARMKTIAEASQGFVYLVSSNEVTGPRASVTESVKPLLRDIKEASSKAVAVGVGISTPEHVKQVAGWGADGVIVGSAIVKLLGGATSPAQGLKEVATFIKSMKDALP